MVVDGGEAFGKEWKVVRGQVEDGEVRILDTGGLLEDVSHHSGAEAASAALADEATKVLDRQFRRRTGAEAPDARDGGNIPSPEASARPFG